MLAIQSRPFSLSTPSNPMETGFAVIYVRVYGYLQSTEFGYSRKDIILLGAGLIAFGYALYYGLQVGPLPATA